MSAAYVNGEWRCYSMPDGRHKHFLGCSHDRPRAAIAHTTSTYVTPTRSLAPADAPTQNLGPK